MIANVINIEIFVETGIVALLIVDQNMAEKGKSCEDAPEHDCKQILPLFFSQTYHFSYVCDVFFRIEVRQILADVGKEHQCEEPIIWSKDY